MQRFNQKTSSDDGSQDEARVHRPKQMAVQELQRRINRAAASHSSSPDEDQPCIAEDSNPENDHDSEDASDYPSDDAHEPDVSMGERVANLMHGPSIRTRRRSQAPISLPWSRGTSRHDEGKLSPNSGSKTDPSNVIKRRVNKHAPVEERIARRPVSVVRDAVQRKSVKSQDPRFIARNNPDNQREADIARRRYGFLYEKAIPTEVSELKAAMRKSTDASEQRRMQVKLSRLQQSLKQHEDRSLELEVESEWKISQKAKIAAGKTPYYLKESEKKKRVLEKKFSRLDEAGQLEKYMAKKRKRLASKMHKKLPFRRKHE